MGYCRKKDTLFVKWIHSIYIEEENWWDYENIADCSWYWKKIVAVKNCFKGKMSMEAFKSAKYTIKLGCKLIIGDTHEEPVKWSKFVWERISMPKHRFIAWLVMLEKLRTKDNLKNIGLNVESSCFLCGSKEESIRHLFFD